MRNVKDPGRSSDSFGARRWAGMGRQWGLPAAFAPPWSCRPPRPALKLTSASRPDRPVADGGARQLPGTPSWPQSDHQNGASQWQARTGGRHPERL